MTSFSHSQATGSEWPLVTIPDFDTWGRNLLEQSETEFVGFVPLVANPDEKALWEQYAKQNPWYTHTTAAAAAAAAAAENTTTTTTTTSVVEQRSKGVAPKIFVLERYPGKSWDVPQPQQGPGPYAPAWQVYPLDRHESIIQFDLLSDVVFQGMYEAVVETGQAVISPVMNLNLFLGGDSGTDDRPRSVYFEPVYDQLDGASSSNNKRLTGILFGVLPWEVYFQGLLDTEEEKVYGVMENSCGQNFTFIFEGPTIAYVGEGDYHDTTIEELVVTTEFGEFSHAKVDADHLDDVYHCHYFLHIYPTVELRVYYQSDTPMVVAALVLFMFFVSAVAYMMYVVYIQKRQKRLLHIATNTSKLVSSLFPASVRDRILQDAEEQAFRSLIQNQEEGSSKSKKNGHRSSMSYHMTASGSRSFLQEHLTNAAENMQFSSRAPIAEVFPQCKLHISLLLLLFLWLLVGHDKT